jgi:hypothetical protein
MGLDQRAGYNDVDIYDWRKHARLQQYMHNVWLEKSDNPDEVFNCQKLILEKHDILQLKQMVEDETLPFCEGGFFWGHQFQEEAMKEYKESDLKFCEDALQWIEEGKEVWYDCWW